MSHWGHRGWGRLPSYNMITVSRICMYRKFTIIAILIIARPLHPSTWNSHGPDVVGKPRLYCMSSPQYVHCTIILYLARYVSPSPIIHNLYAASDWFPADQKGRHIIPTVFPKFV